MKIIDISWPLAAGVTEYKDRAQFKTTAFKTIEQNGARETIVLFNTHTGTHIDAPAHFLADGAAIDQVPLTQLCGTARVIDCTTANNCITREDLAAHQLQKDEIVLCKTRNSARKVDEPFDHQFVYVSEDAARYCVEQGIKAIGIDYLGIEFNQPDHPTHKILLSRNVVIIEGLRLAHVKPGVYQLYCLPLALPGLDGAPARAILVS
ncbi:MAG: cyclase family protein [Candidatus Babeliales bacterium]